MTTDGEPLRPDPGSAVPGEVDSLERFVEQCLAKLADTRYLPENKARAFLEEVAHHHRSSSFRDAVEAAAASLRLDRPPDLDQAERNAAVGQLLADSGIAVVEDGDFRFASQAVADYLAACHIVRRHPQGPRWWRPTSWKYLRPRAVWPWPDDKVTLFVVALWWHNTRPGVLRRLRRLLREKHRDPNILFVTELLRRDLVIESDLREKTIRIHRQQLEDGERTDERWTATVRSLFLLDPELAAADLEHIVQYPNTTITDHRRLAAVDVLTELDAVRGKNNLRILAGTMNGPPQERLDVIVLIRDRDQPIGDRAVRQFMDDPEMGDLRAKAAILFGDHTLWSDMITGDHNLSDSARLALLVELVKLDSTAAIAAAVRFTETAHEEATPVWIANAIRRADRDTALQILNDISRAVRRRISDPVRRSAADLIGEIDPPRAIPELEYLSRDPTMGIESRFNAAHDIVDRNGPLTALLDFANTSDLDRSYRFRAAKKISTVDPEIGGRAFIAIARDCAPADPDQLVLLQEAFELVPGPAAEALTEAAKDHRGPALLRAKAVEIASPMLDRDHILTLYTAIVTTAGNDDAFSVAKLVKGVDLNTGERLMAGLASRSNATPRFKLKAARAAGGYGKPVLKQLADSARPDSLRLEACQALYRIDQKLGIAALQKLVKKRGAGEVRISAALALPEQHSVKALIYITLDRGNENVRLKAGVKAMEKNEAHGRQALVELANDPTISRLTRDKIHRYLS